MPAYREPLFRTIREAAKKDGHEFQVVASHASPEFATRDTEGKLEWARMVPVRKWPRLLGGFEWQSLPWRDILNADVVITSDNLRILSGLAVLLSRRVLRKPVLTWGHGTNFQPTWLSRILASPRFALLRMADRYLVYTQTCVTPLVAMGFDRLRIDITDNAVDTSPAKGLQPLHPEVRDFRERHDLGLDPCIVFLGSWYARKRPELILELGEVLLKRIPNLKVLVIGGGDGVEILRVAHRPWLRLLGPLHGRDKYVALSAGRCLAVTGVAGLNLLDAMAVGVPVVVPLRHDHSPEVSYVQDGANGLIVPDNIENLAEACRLLCEDDALRVRLGANARMMAQRLSIDNMASNIYRQALAVVHDRFATTSQRRAPVVVIYQRMLPYHKARFRALYLALRAHGTECLAIEVASTDDSYGNIDDGSVGRKQDYELESSITTLFPGADYQKLDAGQVHRAVFSSLRTLRPEVVFSPAPAFSEGAGALHYKVRHGGKLILMDDAWAGTDHRGWFTTQAKRLFYGYVDGGFLPSPLHGEYFTGLNIPKERQRYAVDVVSNTECTTPVSDTDLTACGVKGPFLLFVGRLMPRKGLHVVLEVLAVMGMTAPHLVVIGDGPDRESLEAYANKLGIGSRVHWLGRQENAVARRWMQQALALVVPSEFEQWGLVVNEAWNASTLVLGSDTVGALRATVTSQTAWTILPAGNVDGWRQAFERLLKLSPMERANMLEIGKRLAEQYSLATHVESALDLIAQPPRSRPNALVGWMTCRWKGRVVVW